LKNFKIHDKLEKGIFVELYKGNYMTLTLKELREFMEQIPKDTPGDEPIIFRMKSGCCGDFEDMDLIDIENLILNPYPQQSKTKYLGSIVFMFDSLPGYKSCIQAGNTVRQDKEYWDKLKK
jgi:hypothetical protein